MNPLTLTPELDYDPVMPTWKKYVVPSKAMSVHWATMKPHQMIRINKELGQHLFKLENSDWDFHKGEAGHIYEQVYQVSGKLAQNRFAAVEGAPFDGITQFNGKYPPRWIRNKLGLVPSRFNVFEIKKLRQKQQKCYFNNYNVAYVRAFNGTFIGATVRFFHDSGLFYVEYREV